MRGETDLRVARKQARWSGKLDTTRTLQPAVLRNKGLLSGRARIRTRIGQPAFSAIRQHAVWTRSREGPDISVRQLGVFLTCYVKDEAQTIRGLAAELNVSKPAITRALDRLGEFDLVHRKTAPLAASPG
jgi:MarR family